MKKIRYLFAALLLEYLEYLDSLTIPISHPDKINTLRCHTLGRLDLEVVVARYQVIKFLLVADLTAYIEDLYLYLVISGSRNDERKVIVNRVRVDTKRFRGQYAIIVRQRRCKGIDRRTG